jgi:hypothetical protein
MAKNSGQFTDEWGKSAAKERYGKATGSLNQTSEEAPQSKENKRGPDYDNNTPSNWLRGMPSAESKPSFDHGGGKKGK